MATQSIALNIRGTTGGVADAVKVASQRAGVNFSYLMAQAAVESGFRPDAKAAGSSAQGLYQFLKGTWMEVVREHGAKHGLGQIAQAIEKGGVDAKLEKKILDLRNDPKVSALMAAEYARENKAQLEKSVGGKIADVDLYLAHFLGPNGAERFLQQQRKAPDRAAAELFPDAATANRAIFYDGARARSLSEVRELFAAKLDGAARGPAVAAANLTPQPVYLHEGARPRSAVPEVAWIPDGGPPRPRLASSAELMLLTLVEVEDDKIFG